MPVGILHAAHVGRWRCDARLGAAMAEGVGWCCAERARFVAMDKMGLACDLVRA